MVSRSEEEIHIEMLGDADDVGLIQSTNLIPKVRDGLRTENQYVLILGTDSKQFAILERDNDTNRENGFIGTARGEALDNMGTLLNVHRVEALSSEVELSISLSVAGESAVTIPAGTRVILQNIYAGMGYEYVTKEAVTIPAGSTSASIVAENLNPGYVTPIPNGAVTGLEGFDTLTVSNEDYSTHGVDIEEDDVYRDRVLGWSSKNTRGTRACIVDYLDHYEGVDRYKLIPCFDGVGTLKVIVDGQSSVLSSLPSNLYDNAMLFTDDLPVCVAPEEQSLSDFTAVVTINWDALKITTAELSSALLAQISTYVSGGDMRDGSSFAGISMGDDFNPSLLWKFLLEQFPEVSNIYSSTMYEVVSVDDDKKLVLGEVTIAYDNVETS